MTDRRLIEWTSTLGLALLFASCGSYDPANPGTGGTSGQAGTGATAGSGAQAGMGMGGTGGGAAGSGQSGSGAVAGSGQSGSGGGGGGGQSGGGGMDAGSSGAAGMNGGSGGTMEVPCPMPLPDATPCGGDVRGTWAAAACDLPIAGEVDMTGFGLGCQTASITSGTLRVSGTFTAGEDGMFMDGTRTTGEQVVELPPECLTVSGFVTTCDRLGGPAGPVTMSLGYATLDCVDNEATEGCTCEATFDQAGGLGLISIDRAMAGTYTAVDNLLTTTAFGVATEYTYCVMDSTMALNLTTAAKIGTVMAPIVMQKQ